MDDGRHMAFIGEFFVFVFDKPPDKIIVAQPAPIEIVIRLMGGKAGTARTARSGAHAFVVWHNPRCSKSRQTLKILRRSGVSLKVRNYVEDPPAAAEISRAIQLLGVEARGLLRKKEPLYRALGLDWPDTPSATLVRAMAKHPELIERPVVFSGNRAVIGRPPENVRILL